MKGLVVGYDVIGPLMAGPGLRSLRLAEALASVRTVDILIDSESSSIEGSPVGFVTNPEAGEIETFLRAYGVCLASSTFPLTHPWLMESQIPLAVDCYDPYVLENLFMYAGKPPAEARFQHERHLKAQIEALLRADILLCASERQKDLFTGALMVLNRLNPELVGLLEKKEFIKVVPFGIEAGEPPERGALRGKAPGYGIDDEVLIWGGGIWEWFDPINLVKAVGILIASHPRIRLHFLGVKHPNRHIPFPRKAQDAISLAESMDLKDKHVFFGDWVPARERGKYLRDADLGVSFHRRGLETAYSFRTRLMDYLWAELPMVVSSGDDLSAKFAKAGLGEALEDASPGRIASAIDEWLTIAKVRPPEITKSFAMLKMHYRWPMVAEPLLEFFKEPYSTSGHRGEGFFESNLGGMNPAKRPGRILGDIKRIIKGGE